MSDIRFFVFHQEPVSLGLIIYFVFICQEPQIKTGVNKHKTSNICMAMCEIELASTNALDSQTTLYYYCALFFIFPATFISHRQTHFYGWRKIELFATIAALFTPARANV